MRYNSQTTVKAIIVPRDGSDILSVPNILLHLKETKCFPGSLSATLLTCLCIKFCFFPYAKLSWHPDINQLDPHIEKHITA